MLICTLHRKLCSRLLVAGWFIESYESKSTRRVGVEGAELQLLNEAVHQRLWLKSNPDKLKAACCVT